MLRGTLEDLNPIFQEALLPDGKPRVSQPTSDE